MHVFCVYYKNTQTIPNIIYNIFFAANFIKFDSSIHSHYLNKYIFARPNYSLDQSNRLPLTMLNLDRSCFENSVDLDQLASEKPADQDPHCCLLTGE